MTNGGDLFGKFWPEDWALAVPVLSILYWVGRHKPCDLGDGSGTTKDCVSVFGNQVFSVEKLVLATLFFGALIAVVGRGCRWIASQPPKPPTRPDSS